MKKILTFLALCLCTHLYAQDYLSLKVKAEGFGAEKNYRLAVENYQLAFQLEQKDKRDLYNAACYAALAGNTELAFSWINAAVEQGWVNRQHLSSDSDLLSLHGDARWEDLLKKLDAKFADVEKGYNKPLQTRLLKIYADDQELRQQVNLIQEKFGHKSKEYRALWRKIDRLDKQNLVKIKDIIRQHGWVGSELVGDRASAAVFLVIQHSDLSTQEKYLPVMREAVKNKRAYAHDLALLEDRVLMRQGKKQIYGSQLQGDANGIYHVYALEDPDHVDQRRAAIGLPPMSEYVKNIKLTWDLEAYKKSPAAQLKKQ